MYYGSPCPAGTLVVMHWVVDTDHPTQAERIRGYVDGVRMPSIDVRRHPGTPGVMPALGDQLSLGAGTRRVYLGRAHSAKRNARSRIFFAAIYDRVLTAQQLAVRASALRTSDD